MKYNGKVHTKDIKAQATNVDNFQYSLITLDRHTIYLEDDQWSKLYAYVQGFLYFET